MKAIREFIEKINLTNLLLFGFCVQWLMVGGLIILLWNEHTILNYHQASLEEIQILLESQKKEIISVQDMDRAIVKVSEEQVGINKAIADDLDELSRVHNLMAERLDIIEGLRYDQHLEAKKYLLGKYKSEMMKIKH